MPKAKLLPQRFLYRDTKTDFAILSCKLVNPVAGIETHPVYHNLTLKGANIANFELNRRIDCIIEPIIDEKHPYSYKFISFGSFEAKGGKFKLTEKQELQALRSLMTNRQAESCHAAYPHFVSMVLNGEQEQIDTSKIKYVKNVLLSRYIAKIKSINNRIAFMEEAAKWSIESDENLNKIAARYSNIDEFKEDIEQNPYNVLMDVLDWGWARADKAVMKYAPSLACSLNRAEAACIYLLKRNEDDGNTRIGASELFDQFVSLCPESVSYIYEAVTTSSKIYYEPERKYVSRKSTYLAECHVAEVVKKKIANPHYYPMDWQKFTSVDGLDLTDEQSQILEMACKQDVMMLTGSAGSGKSQTLKAIIEMLEANNYGYTLLAPTGIAAKRMREATSREASTIHMFLLSEAMAGDYVLIDESGMVAVDLLSALFNKLNDNTKLIFIADPSQLASISCGNVVRDLLDGGIVPVCNLTKVFRYNTSGIITIATDVRNGDSSHLTNNFMDYKFVEIDTLPIKQIEREYAALLASGYGQDDILILSPFNKGQCGSLVINNYIQDKFNPNPPTDVGWTMNGVEVKFRVGDKVINKKNEYRMPLADRDDTAFVANGDMGRIVDIEPDDKMPQMVVHFDCGDCLVDKAHISRMLLGYCISTHSSQGCQAKAVIVVVDRSHMRLISRNLLYTGVSRAQERLVVIGDMEAIEAGLNVQEEKCRNTWLREVLKDGVD